MNITYSKLLKSSKLPRLEARLLLQQASKLSHAEIISNSENTVSPTIQDEFWQMAKRRAAGEPIAYLLSYREFYGRDFCISDSVLIPRPETELLVDAALQLINKNYVYNVLDLGTGSGVLAITLALEASRCQVFACDLENNALQIAKKNAKQLGAKVDFYQGNWFAAIPDKTIKFDLIVSNPPYIASDDKHLTLGDLRFEPKIALTDFADGLSCLKNIINNAGEYLQNDGWLMLEHGYQQGLSVRNLLEKAGFEQVETLLDIASRERVSLGKKTRL